MVIEFVLGVGCGKGKKGKEDRHCPRDSVAYHGKPPQVFVGIL
jgi:hypothetical protein